MPEWNAGQYLRFEKERSLAVWDLLARLEDDTPVKILDVGCGPGNSTAALHRKFPDAAVTGIDSSSDMLERARRDYPELAFIQCDAGKDLDKMGTAYDLVFSNACIHWIPGQEALIRRMLSLLRPGGKLAVQLPLTQRAPFYRMLKELAASAPWRDYFSQAVESFHSLQPDEYFDILAQTGGNFSIWETTYFHQASGWGDVLEWYRGSGLRPYLQALPPAMRRNFEEEIARRLPDYYEKRPSGRVILPMARLFFTAEK